MRRLIITIITCALAAFMLTACEETQTQKQRNKSIKTRADTFERAEAKHPVPHTENFPLRKMLVEMTKREDLVNHPWYIYVLGDNGNVIGYYVAKTAPINACNFLSSTEELADGAINGAASDDNANFVLKAPSLDGIYYGDAICNVEVFEDYNTSAIIKLRDVKTFVADKPLNLEAEPISVTSRK